MARLFADSEELTPVRWYITDPDAPVYPYSSAFGHPCWEGNRRNDFEGPGCLFYPLQWAPNKYPGCRNFKPVGTPEEFLHGLTSFKPIPQLDCCAWRVGLGGGIVLGGGGPISWTVYQDMLGRLGLSATATAREGATESLQGSLALRGQAGESATGTQSEQGSLALRGQAGESATGTQSEQGSLGFTVTASSSAGATEGVSGRLALRGQIGEAAAAIEQVLGQLGLVGRIDEAAAAIEQVLGQLGLVGRIDEAAAAIEQVLGQLGLVGKVGESATATESELGRLGLRGTYTGTSHIPLTAFNCASITAAGTTQGTATAIGDDTVDVTTPAMNNGVILPSGCYRICVHNIATVNTLKVYPPSGDALGSLGTNSALTMTGLARYFFIRCPNGIWAYFQSA